MKISLEIFAICKLTKKKLYFEILENFFISRTFSVRLDVLIVCRRRIGRVCSVVALKQKKSILSQNKLMILIKKLSN